MKIFNEIRERCSVTLLNLFFFSILIRNLPFGYMAVKEFRFMNKQRGNIIRGIVILLMALVMLYLVFTKWGGAPAAL